MYGCVPQAMHGLGVYYSTSFRVDPTNPMDIESPRYDEASRSHIIS